MASRDDLIQLYRDVLGREPDQAGLDWWVSQVGPTLDADEKRQFVYGAQGELINSIINDGKISSAEALDLHKIAKDYGLTKDSFSQSSGVDANIIDQIYGKYDKTLESAMGALSSASTPAEKKDALANLISLQDNYGLTSGDLSGHSGDKYTAEALSSLIDPVRNFNSDYQKILNDPKLTSKDVSSFLSKYDTPETRAFYGDTTLDNLKAVKSDFTGKYGGYEGNLNPIAVENVYRQIKAQQDAGTASSYSGGALGTGYDKGSAAGFGSLSELTYDMAKNLVASGVTDITQIKQVPARTYVDGDPKSGFTTQSWEDVYTDSGETGPIISRQLVTNSVPSSQVKQDGAGNYYVEDPSRKMAINGAKDVPLQSNYAERTGGNSWSGTFAGKGNTAYNIQFNESGVPVFYTTGASSSDGMLQNIVSLAAIIPSPIQPFAQLANAAYAASQGNTFGAIMGVLGAASSYGSMAASEINALQSSGQTAAAAAQLQNTFGGTLAQNLGALRTAQALVSGLNAIDKKNWAGVFNAASGLFQQAGGGSVGDALSKATNGVIPANALKIGAGLASAAIALEKNDAAGFLDAMGSLANSPDARIAASAKRMYDAMAKGDPVSVMSAAMGFNNTLTANADASTIVKAIKSSPELTQAVADAGGADALNKATDEVLTDIAAAKSDTATAGSGYDDVIKALKDSGVDLPKDLTSDQVNQIVAGVTGDTTSSVADTGAQQDTLLAEKATDTTTDAGQSGQGNPNAPLLAAMADYLNANALGDKTGITRNEDGTYTVDDPSNNQSLKFGSDGSFLGSMGLITGTSSTSSANTKPEVSDLLSVNTVQDLSLIHISEPTRH